jgi:hypothetical protein
MRLTDNGGKEFEQAPVGNHIGRCVGMIDLGTQQGEYLGKTTHARKIVLRFELPNELISEGEWAGKPFTVSKFYTASLGEKANLRKDLESWRGRPFTPEELRGFESKNLLDKPCMVNVTRTEKGKAKIAGITPMPKGLTAPGRVNDLLYFSLEPDEYRPDAYELLNDYWKGEIQKSPEWSDLQGKPRRSAVEEMESDIPF